MEFELNKEQELIRRTFHDFSESVIRPNLDILEHENRMPDEIVQGLADIDGFGLPIPEEYGGAGAGYVGYSLAMQEISRVAPGVSIMMAGHTAALGGVLLYGSEEQRKKWIPAGAQGREIWSFAFTEPQTGSDPKQLSTKIHVEGDHYVVNGTKRFITNAAYRNGPIILIGFLGNEGGDQELSMFYIDKASEGYSTSQPWEKIGQHGGPLEDAYLENVSVPLDNKIGGNVGFALLKKTIAFGKVGVCSNSLGSAQAAYEEAFKYVTTKMHRGTPIAKFQVVQARLAQCYQKYITAEVMTRRLATMADEAVANIADGDSDFPGQAAMTKRFVCEQAFDCARDAQLLHSAYGTVTDYDITRILRDASMGANLEGQEDMQDVISSSYLLGDLRPRR